MACIDSPSNGKQQCVLVRWIEWNKKAFRFELNVNSDWGELPDTRRAIPLEVGQHLALLNEVGQRMPKSGRPQPSTTKAGV